MKKNLIMLFVFVFCGVGCDGQQTENREVLKSIAGCWKGRQIARFDRPYSEQILFSLRPDGSLAQSMIYEIGPRSRVWILNSDVTVQEGKIRWDHQEGVLSENKDSMRVTRGLRDYQTTWLFVRERSADSLMVRLRDDIAEPYVYQMPDVRNDGWPCADLTESGMDNTKILKLVEDIMRGDHDDIHSLLIVKDHKLVVEEYFAAKGKKHGPFITGLFRDKAHHLASTTKCVTSTLVGLAIDHGFIKGVQDPIHRYLPAYGSLFGDDKKRIRISDMLKMTPGFEWHQFGVPDAQNDGMQMWETDDVIRFVLQKPLDAELGKKFNYTNGVPTVTGAILKNAVGMEVGRFAEEYLFQPLGISEYVWTSYPDGSIETDGGLALRPRDLAKIGQLYLNNGLWKGGRILSEEWVRESTKERLRFGPFKRWGYGYHWTQAESRVGDRMVRSYFVPGDGNQILAVFPEIGMVVVLTAGNYGLDPKPIYYSLFEKFILPALPPGE